MTPDPLCTANHYGTLDADCRCNEYAKVRADERKRISKAAAAHLEAKRVGLGILPNPS